MPKEAEVRKRRQCILLLMVLAIIAIGLETKITSYCPEVTGDSVHYLMGAENLLAGNGYSRLSGGGEIKPLTGFPPGYSIIIAGITFPGLDPITATRFLNILLFGANVFLASYLLFLFTGSQLAAAACSLLILTADGMIHVHTRIMSEPLFIFLTLLIMLLMINYLKSHNLILLCITGLLVGFTSLVRYIGLGLVPVTVLILILFDRGSWRQRLRSAGILVIMSILPVVLWFARNASLAGTTVNRSLIYHPIDPSLLARYVDEVISWAIPVVFNLNWRPRLSHLAIASLFVFILIIFLEMKKHSKDKQVHLESRNPISALPLFLLFFIASYIATLLATTAFLDAGMGAVERYMTPVFTASVMLAICIVFRLADLLTFGQVMKAIGLSGFFILVGFYTQESLHWITQSQEPVGYLALPYSSSEPAEALELISYDRPIITNDIEQIYVLSGRYSYALPIKYDVYKQKVCDDFPGQMEAMQKRLANGAVLVLTDSLEGRLKQYPSRETLTEGLVLWQKVFHMELYIDPDAGYDIE